MRRPEILCCLFTLMFCAAPRADEVTRQDNLVAWWLMGESAALAAGDTIAEIPDQSGRSVPAAAQGTPQRVAGNPFWPLPFGVSYATETGPESGFLLAPDDSSFNFGDEDFSVSLWARSDNGGGQFDKLFQRIVDGSTFWQAETDGVGGVIWNIRSGGNAEIKTNNIFAGNTGWHHLVFLRDTVNQELRAYVDGELSISPAGMAGTEGEVGSLAGNGSLAIGAETGSANPFEGGIDDLRIYNVALGDEDVAAIYNDGLGDLGEPPPLEIVAITATEDAVTLTFHSQPGIVYAIDASPDLADWSEEVDDFVEGEEGSNITGFTERFEELPMPVNRFYRVRESQSP